MSQKIGMKPKTSKHNIIYIYIYVFSNHPPQTFWTSAVFAVELHGTFSHKKQWSPWHHSQRGLTWHNFRLAFDLEISRYSRLQQLLRGLMTPPCLHVVPKDLREPDQKKNTCDGDEVFQLEFPNFWLINLAACLFHYFFLYHQCSYFSSTSKFTGWITH